jgi:hypothetical protein
VALFLVANDDLATSEKWRFPLIANTLLALGKSHTRIPTHAKEKTSTGEEVSAFKGQSTAEGDRRAGHI